MLSRKHRKQNTPLRDVGEWGWLKRLGRTLPAAGGRNVLVGFGDDAACLAFPFYRGPSPGSKKHPLKWELRTTGKVPLKPEPQTRNSLLVTTDLLIEGTHFTWRTATPATLGEKAVAVNVSDIAAMGGRPTAMVVGLGAPAEFPLAKLESVFRAMERSCRRWGIAIVGGDTVRSECLILAPTLLGEFEGPRERLPLRSRMRKEQYLYVTGTVGDSAAGLALMLGNDNRNEGALSSDDRRHLVARHRTPLPRLKEGQWLAQQIGDVAMIDLSDDLKTSLGLLKEASRVGATVWLDRLPISAALRRFCRSARRDVLDFAACGGEDYELLFATSLDPRALGRRLRGGGIATRVTCIGRVGGRTIGWLDKQHQEVPLISKPFEHFGMMDS